ncbi:MAG: deoxynucleoside kinase [Bacteroidota bacterium]
MSKEFTYRFIAVEGNIGAGKTSLASIIAHRQNALLALEEFADNTFLPQFYQQPDRYAFPLELSFLAERYQQLKQKIEESVEQDRLLVTDYLFEKSLLFAQVNLQDDELKLFTRFFEMMLPTLRKPDLIIYLDKTTPALSRNINKRGRSFEKEISELYLHKVSESYHRYLTTLSDIPVLFIESDDMDFVNDHAHLKFILSQIEHKRSAGLHRMRI